MDMITREDLAILLHHQDIYCVSLYMPTHRAGPEIRQDPIRLKNLLRQAEDRLAALGTPAAEVHQMLGPAAAMLGDSSFWRLQGDGLALFISPSSFHQYRLPVDFQELLVVADRFHLKPLLPLFAHGGHFYILALSQNEVRFFRGTLSGLDPVELRSLPENLSETLRLFDAEKQGQINTDIAMLQYCRSINDAVCKYLASERAPLVLAAVEPLFAIYRQANTYPYCMNEGIYGNPEGLKLEDLHGRGQAIAQTTFLMALEATAEQCHRNENMGRASKKLDEVLRAATQGKVDKLIVAVGLQRWGTYDPATDSLRLHFAQEPGDEDLLNRAAMLTLSHGGEVYAVMPEDVPDRALLAAVFRY